MAASLGVKLFNVGHGDCILIRFPNGKLGLVDSNFNPDLPDSCVVQEIRDSGGELEFLCMTHPHDDHFKGMLSILNSQDIVVKSFWHPMASVLESVLRFYGEKTAPECDEARFVSDKNELENSYGELLDIFDFLDKKSIKLDRRINEFQVMETIGGVKIHSLSPPHEYGNRYERKLRKALQEVISKKEYIITRHYANRLSIVLLLEYGRSKIILGGDALRQNWRRISTGTKKRDFELKNVDCFKVSHHGASDSFYDEMWSQYLANKGVLIVSCGRATHPSAEFVKSIDGDWDIYCTNKGIACSKDGGRLSSDRLGLGLDLLTHDSGFGRQCCSTIKVDIYPDSKMDISLARNPKKVCHRKEAVLRKGP